MIQEPVHAPLEAGQLVEQVGFDRLHREQRHQTHQRAHLQLLDVAIRKVQDVVEELVFIIPERYSHAADVVQRFRDIQEVFKELAGEILVDGVFSSELEGDGKHVQAIHAHPSRPICLAEVATGRFRTDMRVELENDGPVTLVIDV